MNMLSLPKVFYELHYKDGTFDTIALDNEVDRVSAMANPTVIWGLDHIVSLDTSWLSRVLKIDPKDKSADTSKAYLEKLKWPIRAVGDLRLEKYKITHNKNMPLSDFKKWMESFVANWKKREEEWDTVYAPCYRMHWWE